MAQGNAQAMHRALIWPEQLGEVLAYGEPHHLIGTASLRGPGSARHTPRISWNFQPLQEMADNVARLLFFRAGHWFSARLCRE
ncbi:MAG TPA: hypothetical protein VFB12_08950 [Ktedonobacteraceae bacterium]|nr:hypothetical protein [Ktedonobacteraceae bacterium]